MTIGDIGEFALIERITSRFTQTSEIELGPGDDAAVVRAPDGRVVVTTDMLVEGRHFRRDWSGGYDIGRKAAAQNLADVAAMGARPTALFVGFGAPGDTPLDWVDALNDGLRDECAAAGAAVAGGDVTSADHVVLGITALGDMGGLAPVTRSGARPGDVLAVCGRLGWAAAGLDLLRRGEAAGHEELAEAHRRPRPPYAAGPQAARLGATAMLDVSDGLVQDVGHIAKASGVGIDIRSGALTPPPGVGVRVVLTGGDDHALAATFPPSVALPREWTAIGAVVEGSGTTVDGAAYTARGWEHFR